MEKQLNLVMKYFITKNIVFADYNNFYKWCKENTFENEEILQTALTQLKEYGYLNDKRLDGKWFLTIKGRIFLNRGGFESETKHLNYRASIEKVSTWSLIFGGIAGGIYYTVEICKMFLCHH